jgi:hypothetical protein
MSKSKKTKLTKKELEDVISKKTSLDKVVMEIGNIEVNKQALSNLYASLKEDWDDNTKKLESKYGSVNVNLETGEISPIEEVKK